MLLLGPCARHPAAAIAAAEEVPATTRLAYHANLRVLVVEVAAANSSRRRWHCDGHGDRRRRDRRSMGLSVLINTRLIAECASSTLCAVQLPNSETINGISVAVYETCSSGHMILLHNLESDDPIPRSTAVATAASVVTALPLTRRPRVLLYNTVEHTQFALSATSWHHTANNLIPTIENVVQSNGSLSCTGGGSSCTKCSPATNSTACCLLSTCGVYHATPTIRGVPTYYCWWRHRNGS
eukprot:SAG11_NODE_7865_length_1086_cov_1.839919_1_plen_239_part_01